jgi:hypothetical protein
MITDPIGQALLKSPHQPPRAVTPPSTIACPHCGTWIVEPRYTFPVAASLIPMNEGNLRTIVQRYRNHLPEPTYTRVGTRTVRMLTATDILAIRTLRRRTFPKTLAPA